MSGELLTRPPATRFVTVHNQHDTIVLESGYAEDLPPLAGLPADTEPPYTGATWQAPAPARRLSLRRRALTLAMRAAPWLLVAFTAYILLVHR